MIALYEKNIQEYIFHERVDSSNKLKFFLYALYFVSTAPHSKSAEVTHKAIYKNIQQRITILGKYHIM